MKPYKRVIPVDNPKKGTKYYSKYWVWEYNGYYWTNIEHMDDLIKRQKKNSR